MGADHVMAPYQKFKRRPGGPRKRLGGSESCQKEFGMEESVQEPADEARPHLCLSLCPGCRASGAKGGACHLLKEHPGQHECNAVSDRTHKW